MELTEGWRSWFRYNRPTAAVEVEARPTARVTEASPPEAPLIEASAAAKAEA